MRDSKRDTDVLTVFWTLWERARVGWFGRMALKCVKYHIWNESSVQVRCTILDAWGWCTGTTQRDGMGREEGEGFRMGNTCIPVADPFWYLAKLIQFCKVKKKKKRILEWVPIPSPADLPDPGNEPGSPALQADSFSTEQSIATIIKTLCNPMHYTVHGIPQARILEWVDHPFSSGYSRPRNQTGVSCIAGRFFTSWATREAPSTTGGFCALLINVFY